MAITAAPTALSIETVDRSRSALEAISAWFATWGKTVQHAQMMRALMQVNDTQLAKLGITRSDIPQHAEKLINRAR